MNILKEEKKEFFFFIFDQSRRFSTDFRKFVKTLFFFFIKILELNLRNIIKRKKYA